MREEALAMLTRREEKEGDPEVKAMREREGEGDAALSWLYSSLPFSIDGFACSHSIPRN